MEANPSPERRPGQRAHLKLPDRRDWQLILWINGAARQREDLSGRAKTATSTTLKALHPSVAAGCEAHSEGSDDKMSFWIWSESFLNLIPPGPAPEIQIWHVGDKKESRAIQSSPVKEEEGGARDREKRDSEPSTCFVFTSLFHLLISIDECVAVFARRRWSVTKKINQLSDWTSGRLAAWRPRSLWYQRQLPPTVHFLSDNRTSVREQKETGFTSFQLDWHKEKEMTLRYLLHRFVFSTFSHLQLLLLSVYFYSLEMFRIKYCKK